MDVVDLRSDTITQPTTAMREAMANAAVGDDVWREDPTSRALEERAADLLGKEAALFVPSGTMANQIAMLLHCRPGDEVIAGRGAHVRLYESGGAAALAGVQVVEVGDDDGTFDADAVARAIQPGDYHAPITRLVAFENTHNRGGGRVWPIERLHATTALARSRGLSLHLDGARIWNAAVATGRTERALCEPFDTVSACFSKGLGAPVGSVVAGSRAHVADALRLRKRLGGGMRQVGILCAAALFALENNRERLAEDHRNALALAAGLAGIEGFAVDASTVETNIVIFEVTHAPAAEVAKRAAAQGVLVAPVSPKHLRAVTSLEIDAAGIVRAIDVLRRALG